MFAGAAFTDQDSIKTENAEAVNLLTSLNIIQGRDDGSFDPAGTVTRAEMAKMIAMIRTDGNDVAESYKNAQSSFTDLEQVEWAKGYIKYLQNTGIISGRSDTIFDPAAQVTTVEAMKMALVLGGYDAGKAELTGPKWMSNTIALASTNQLDRNVGSGINSGCSRQDAAQILANTLEMTAVQWSEFVNGFVNDSDQGLAMAGEKISVGRKWMKIWTSVGTLVKLDGHDLALSMSKSDIADSDKDDKKNPETDFTKLDKDYSDLMGQKVKVLYDDGKNNSVLAVYPLVENVVYTTTANSTGRDDNKLKFGGATYSVEYYGYTDSTQSNTTAVGNAIRTYKDGVATLGTTLENLDQNTFNPNMYTFVDTDGNGKIDTLIVKTYNVSKVSYVSSDRIIAGGTTYKYVDEEIQEGLAKDDWVIITRNLYQDNSKIVKAEMVTAKLEGLRDKSSANAFMDHVTPLLKGDNTYSEYQIDGNWSTGAVKYQKGSEIDLGTVRAGENVKAVVVNGIAFYVKKASGTGIGRIDNVAVIVNSEKTNQALTERVKVAFFDGTTAVVEVDDDGEFDVDYNNLVAGHAYEYSISGGKYSFQELNAGSQGTNISNKKAGSESYDEYYGDMTYLGASGNLTGNPGSTITSVNGFTIDDDAQVLLFKPSNADYRRANQQTLTSSGLKYDNYNNDTKVITGKQFKTLTTIGNDVPLVLTTSATGTKYYGDDETAQVFSFYGDMDGLDRIGALVVPVVGIDKLAKTYNHYGYIVEDAAKYDTRNISYRLWTGESTITVHEEYTRTGDRVKGVVIGYDKLTAGEEFSVIDDVEPLTVGDKKITFTGIKSVSNDQKTVQFYDTIAPTGRDELEVVRNSTVLYVNTKADSDDAIGVLDGDIKSAVKDNNDHYMANALVFGNEDDIELLVVEQTAWMDNGYYRDHVASNVAFGSDPSEGNETVVTSGTFEKAADLAAALANNNDVRADYGIPAGSYEVKDGQTLILNSPVIDNTVILNGKGNVTLRGYVDAGNGSLKIRTSGTLTIESTAEIDSTSAGKIDLSNVGAVVDQRSTTPSTTVNQLEKFLAGSNNVTIVSGALTTTGDHIGTKTLTTSGSLNISGNDVDATLGNANATAQVTVGGTLTMKNNTATTLNGTWKVANLASTATTNAVLKLTVKGSLEATGSAVATVELTADAGANVTLPNAVTALNSVVLTKGTNDNRTTVSAPNAIVGTSLDTQRYSALTVKSLANAVTATDNAWKATDSTAAGDVTITLNGGQGATVIPQYVTVNLVEHPAGKITNADGSLINVLFAVVNAPDLEYVAGSTANDIVKGAKLCFRVPASNDFAIDSPTFYNSKEQAEAKRSDVNSANDLATGSNVYTGAADGAGTMSWIANYTAS